MADNYWGNMSRAVLGKGLAMDWGDELEARIRTLAGDETYEEELNMINDSYTQFANDNPKAALMGEIGGGFIPLAASLIAAPFTGGASTAGTAVAAARTTGALNKLRQLGTTAAKSVPMPKNTIGKGMVYGGGSGIVSGVGAGNPGDRFEGGAVGLVIGSVLGAGIPLSARAGGAAWNAIKERLIATESMTDIGAIKRIYDAVSSNGGTMQDVVNTMQADAYLGVPATIGTTTRQLTNLTDAVNTAGRGDSPVIIQDTLEGMRSGSRARVGEQVKDAVSNDNFYATQDNLITNLRRNADDVYDKAYAFGAVDDPRILNLLENNSAFKEAYKRAKEISQYEMDADMLAGGDGYRFMLQGEGEIPDVRTLDYIKRGLDDVIRKGFDGNGMAPAQANALKSLRQKYINILDEVTEVDGVSAYRNARNVYKGDIEVVEALELGLSDFSKPSFAPEQVSKLLNDFSQAEREVFAIGATRSILNKITTPSNEANYAKRIIGSPDMRAKIQLLFPNTNKSGYDLLEAALLREKQLYERAGKVLGGSPTQARKAAVDQLESNTGAAEAAGDAIQSSFNPISGLMSMAVRVLQRATIPEKVQEKMAKMLMSESPEEVAAVVKLLEDYTAKAVPRATNIGRTEAATILGAATTGKGLSSQDKTSNFSDEEVEESVRKRDAAR